MSITITANLKAHLALPGQTTCTIWLVKKTNGSVLGFTDLDQNLSYNLESYLTSAGLTIPEVVGTGLVSYVAAVGYTRTDIVGKADISVDNLELHGVINSPSINEADLHAGLWDYAFYVVALV